MENRDPFEYRIVPKNNWELVWWMIVDKKRAELYESHISSTKETHIFISWRSYFLHFCPGFILISFLLWGGTIAIISINYNQYIEPWSKLKWDIDFLSHWHELNFAYEKIAFLLGKQFNCFVKGLFIGYTTGFLSGFLFGTISWFIWTVRRSNTFFFGLLGGLFLALWGSLLGGVFYGVMHEIVTGWRATFTIYMINLGIILAVAFILYVVIVLFSYKRVTLTNNIYLISGEFNEIPFIRNRLVQECLQDPKLGLLFVDFLVKYRPNQLDLAALLLHASTSTLWKYAAIEWDEKRLSFPECDQEGFQIPTRWQEQLTQAQKALIAAETTNLIGTRVVLFQDFLTSLEALHKSVRAVTKKTWRDKIYVLRRINWYRYYADALEEWLKVAREKYAELQALAALTEPIATNRYQTGGALSPTYNQAVFMEREDLREQLSAQLYTTQNFSVFFLQGQRRVGKTSLLKFLPHILGRRFELVYLDLQGSIRSVPDFLEKWQRAFVAHFDLKDVPPLTAADTWAATFEALHLLFSKIAQERDVKIILALDEYEELHTHLAKDPEQGAALLGAIRHFSQHQAEVSLMFVGLRFFSELQSPNWNEYFPQSVPIQVGYLNREKTFQLIEVSTLDFEEGIKERIFDLTQGHPSLIQKICYELVQIANRENRRRLTHADLEAALRTMIYIRDNGVTDIFWSQNCELPIDKDIVRAIVEGKPLPPQSRQRLRRLIEYGFIVEEGAAYRMRVPIFEEWVRRFGVE